jgi:beta-1,2-mannobiose phosphorylase / 1,2-beta-oligomannan phosphorylase
MMRPRPHQLQEASGVLNPGCARGRDGQLYLFPRMVAEGNHSGVGIARVVFGRDGNPIGVRRRGVALMPEANYEFMSTATYGCEDARVTYVPALDRYVMAYVAITRIGPRVALAVSEDLLHWTRLGLADFVLESDIDLNVYNNKDPLLMPEPVLAPNGRPALAVVHRPMYEITPYSMNRTVELPLPHGVADPRQSMWLSYADLDAVRADVRALARLQHHQPLAGPRFSWERVKVGGGAPPLLTHLGWLLIYHGVGVEWDAGDSGAGDAGGAGVRHQYSAGVLVLDRHDPRRVLYRSPRPILEPETEPARQGVGGVVFPTGLDPRTPPGPGSRVDMYYGIADCAIGAGYFTLPTALPTGENAIGAEGEASLAAGAS